MAEDLSHEGGSAGTADTSPAWAVLGAAGREKAEAFLDEQMRLVRLQADDLLREDKLRHWSLIVRHISDVLKLTFEFALAGIALAIVIGLGVAVWTAAHDNSLVIDAFSVPPDLAARGLTGHAIAAQVQDKLTRMQALTDSARPAASYANNWGDSIKVQIPDTGISVGEFYHLLVLWFGHQTHVSGEVFHTAKGLAITARVSGGEGQMVTSDSGDVEALVKGAAEKIYAVTQPYRYANYLANDPSTYDAGILRARQLYAHGSRLDRLWSTTMLATQARMSDPIHAPEISRAAIALAPGFALTYMNLGESESVLDHTEAALQAFEKTQTLLSQGSAGMSPPTRKISLAAMSAIVAEARGNFGEALRDNQNAMGLPDYSQEVFGAQLGYMRDLANSHQGTMAHHALASQPAVPNTTGRLFLSLSVLRTHAALGDWQAVLRDRSQIQSNMAAVLRSSSSMQPFVDVKNQRSVWPVVAEALAHTGQFAAAEALIARTPLDCDLCVRMRGRIAAIKHDWKAAAHWFAMVSARTPSIPFADYDWGRMLMAKGDLDGAIAKFESAHRKGPHYRRPAGDVGRGADREEPLRPGAGEVRGSGQRRAQMGPAASEMGRGAAVVRRSCGCAKAVRHCRQALADTIRKIPTRPHEVHPWLRTNLTGVSMGCHRTPPRPPSPWARRARTRPLPAMLPPICANRSNWPICRSRICGAKTACVTGRSSCAISAMCCAWRSSSALAVILIGFVVGGGKRRLDRRT